LGSHSPGVPFNELSNRNLEENHALG
jgi:hypothetical protein